MQLTAAWLLAWLSKLASSSRNCSPFCSSAMSEPGATLLGSSGAWMTLLSCANVKAECVNPAAGNNTQSEHPGQPNRTAAMRRLGDTRSR